MTFPKNRQLRRGEQIYASGDRPRGLLKVGSGAAIVFVILEDGRRQILDLAGPGDLLHFEIDGELDHYAEALTDLDLQVIEPGAIVTDPAFLQYYLEQARMRLAVERRHITMLGRKSAQERLAEFLEYCADCLGCAPGALDLPMTRQQIADYLGLTLETVSRIFARWVREGHLKPLSPGHYEMSQIKDAPGPARQVTPGVPFAA